MGLLQCSMRKIIKRLTRRLVIVELQAPTHLLRRLLAATGYFRLRTLIASRGEPVLDSNLYRPLYSPWEGDAEFEKAYRPIRSLTLVSRERCHILWKTLQQALHLQGDFMECGVFRGGTALLAAQTLAGKLDNERALHLYDSFKGMPKTIDGIDGFRSGDFDRTSVEAVTQLLSPYPFVKLHPGFIPDTFADSNIPAVAWAHVDVDIYKSVQDCIDYIYPRLVRGGFLLFDDYGFPSCSSTRRAVDEAFSARPEVPLCLPTGQCLVVKVG